MQTLSIVRNKHDPLLFTCQLAHCTSSTHLFVPADRPLGR
ncbi:Protein of unknown function [Pyronema omphalodes CBS 100304]|uniref:Uncharacterized protein n=1 Tax=Pyronema omphalodes (strain CBS 100304) TaxID=1076935 RepID=U4LCG2_PYROM|nr:Protein of unknown function [Pyronema omphalodes CBS 100304]